MYGNERKNCPSGSVPYIIRKGDTLIQIAKQYNSTVNDIMTSNPNLNPDNLMIGQKICIPLTVQLYPTCPTRNYYVVQKGDTFQSIADYFNTTYQQLFYANFGIDPKSLYEDQILCIPVAPSPVHLVVNLQNQSLSVYQKEKLIKRYTIAAVNPQYPIKRGNYVVLNKMVDPGVEEGARWLGLSKAGFGIHGTNTPEFIKNVASDGSIIMSNQDVSQLFNLVPVGTNVSII